MRAKDYPALVDAIDSGLLITLARADKHASDPLTDAQRARIHREGCEHLLTAICERFHFEDAPEE